MSTPIVAIAVVALAVVMIYLLAGVRIVRPYQKGIVEILGRYRETVDPGLRLILPAFFKLRIVDMREQVVDVPPQEVITKDNVVVAVDAVVYYEPTDPQRLVYNVADFMMAITKLAQTNLRNLIGDMDLDSALTSRDQINTTLRNILDEATDKWGVRVGRVEIQRIDPPVDVMNAMHEQMKAERTRRAVVTQADGQREAAIARAEGEKRSAILTAEGLRERQILEAQGEADAIRAVADAESFRLRTVADGEADAVTSVYGAIKAAAPNNELIAIKYIEALRFIADGRATKIFLPTETAGVMGSIAGIAELFASSVDDQDSGQAGADSVSASGDGSVLTGAEIAEPDPS
jgi:regulator of protease activity HflC (stomatin/prohibitin superfamily)